MIVIVTLIKDIYAIGECATVYDQGLNAVSIWGLHMISTSLTLTKAKAFGYDATATDYEEYKKNGNSYVFINNTRKSNN